MRCDPEALAAAGVALNHRSAGSRRACCAQESQKDVVVDLESEPVADRLRALTGGAIEVAPRDVERHGERVVRVTIEEQRFTWTQTQAATRKANARYSVPYSRLPTSPKPGTMKPRSLIFSSTAQV